MVHLVCELQTDLMFNMRKLCYILLILLRTTHSETPDDQDGPCEKEDIRKLVDATSRTWSIDDDAVETHGMQTVLDCARDGDTVSLKTTKTIRPNSRLVVRKKLTIKGQPPLRNEKMEGNRRASLTCPPGEGLFLLRKAVALETLDIEGCYLKSDASVTGIVVADACSEESGRRLLALRGVAFIENQNFGGSIGPSVEKAACYEIEMKAVQFNGNKFSRSATLGSVNRLTDVRLDGNVGKAYFFEFANGSDTRVHDMKAAKNKGGVLNFIESDAIVNGSRFESNEAPDCAVRCRDSKVNFSSTVFDDNASPVAGAAVSMTGGEGMFFNVSATNNSAERGSAFSIVDSKRIAFNSCRFESNAASDGALRVEAKSEGSEGSLEIVDSDFAKNRGGAVYVQLWNSSSMIVNQSRFRDNVPGSLETSRNGGLHVDATLGLHLRIQETIFERNIGGNGGAILLTNITGSLRVLSSNFSDNSATDNDGTGGAVQITPMHNSKTVAEFRRCHFRNNKASQFGGAIAAGYEDINLVISQSSFSKNTASGGGALVVHRMRHTHLESCTFEDNSATSEGGAIWIDDVANSLRAWNSIFARNEALSGGAVMSDQTILNFKSCTFYENSAKDHGGAVRIRSGTEAAYFVNSTFARNHASKGGALYVAGTRKAVISEGSFEGNNAAVYGGAIHVLLYDTKDKFQLENSSVVGNRAYIGGGAFFDRDQCRARLQFRKGRVRIHGTQFRGNLAEKAGGAYFVDRSELVDTDCSLNESRPWKIENGSVESNMDCPDMVDNAVGDGGYGPNVATPAMVFYAVLHYKNGTDVTMDYGTEVLFDNWRSGSELPDIEVVVLDRFHQGPAMTKTGKKWDMEENPNRAEQFEGYAKATLASTSYNRLVLNPLITDVHTGRGIISVGGPFQTPGTYVLSLWVGNRRSKSITLVVKMRKCLLNEAAILDQKRCHECDTNHYNLDHMNDTCLPCPERLNCSKWGLFPKEHRWLPSPCSTKVRTCLSRSACSFGDRDDKIGEFFDEVPPPMTCDALNASSLKLFSNLQCNTGYEGVLCGTCSEGYGQYDLNCYKCKPTFFVVLLFFGQTMWLFVVCAAAVISSLSDVGSMEGVSWASQIRSGSPLPATESQTQRDEDCDIAHRNMTESVKILINFAQLNSVAVTINTSWTKSIKRALRILSLLGAVTAEATVSLDCLFDKDGAMPRSVGRVILNLLAPFAVLFVGFLYWAIVLRNDRVKLNRRLVLTAIVVFYVSFIGWVEELAAALNCVTVDDGGDPPRRLWTEDTSVECFVGSHNILVWVLVIPLILALAGFSLGCAFYLYYEKINSNLSVDAVQEMFGFMYAAYKPECVYWESVVLIRKALLGLVVVFGASIGSNVQSITAISILILSVFLQTRLVPYKDDYIGLNTGEVYALLVVIFTFISGLYYHDPSVSSLTRRLVTMIAVALIVGFFLYISLAIYNRSVVFCRLALERDSIMIPENKKGFGIIMKWIRHRMERQKYSTAREVAPLVP